MIELPRITYEQPNYKEKLDKIFEKLLKYEEGYSKIMVEIRKKQILNHSKKVFIIDTLYDLANLIDTSNPHAETIIKISHEKLIELHSPVIFNIPQNFHPFHKWEKWTFNELYDKYQCLALDKGWEDYYTLPKDFSKNKKVTKWRLDFDIDYNLIKNYHILDMLNDLIVNDYLICGYEVRSFINLHDENKLLKTFNQNCLIDVKLKEKYSPEELRSIFNNPKGGHDRVRDEIAKNFIF